MSSESSTNQQDTTPTEDQNEINLTELMKKQPSVDKTVGPQNNESNTKFLVLRQL